MEQVGRENDTRLGQMIGCSDGTDSRSFYKMETLLNAALPKLDFDTKEGGYNQSW